VAVAIALTRRHSAPAYLTFILLACLVFLAVRPAHAGEVLYDKNIYQQMMADGRNNLTMTQAGALNGWQDPYSFNSVYCGNDTLNVFDQLALGLQLQSAFGLVQNLMQQALSKTCNSSINAMVNNAIKACVPFLGLGAFGNLGLNLGQFCGVSPLSGGGPVGMGVGVGPMQSYPNQHYSLP
jgi:hypothetical protein